MRYDTHAHIRRRLKLDWFTCRIGNDDPSVAKEINLQQVFGLFFAVLERPVQHAVPRSTFVDKRERTGHTYRANRAKEVVGRRVGGGDRDVYHARCGEWRVAFLLQGTIRKEEGGREKQR